MQVQLGQSGYRIFGSSVQRLQLHWNMFLVLPSVSCPASKPGATDSNHLAHVVYDMNKIKIDEALYTFSSSDYSHTLKGSMMFMITCLWVITLPFLSYPRIIRNNVPELRRLLGTITFDANRWSEIKQEHPYMVPKIAIHERINLNDTSTGNKLVGF